MGPLVVLQCSLLKRRIKLGHRLVELGIELIRRLCLKVSTDSLRLGRVALLLECLRSHNCGLRHRGLEVYSAACDEECDYDEASDSYPRGAWLLLRSDCRIWLYRCGCFFHMSV